MMVNMILEKNYKKMPTDDCCPIQQQVVGRPFWEYKRLGHAN
jgi:hypothetical protein